MLNSLFASWNFFVVSRPLLRRPPKSIAPAGSAQNVKAYQNMVAGDYQTMSNSTSNNCDTIQDNGCQAAINRVVPTLQRWVKDLDAFPTPARYALIDGQLRHHLTEGAAELNAAAAFHGFGLSRANRRTDSVQRKLGRFFVYSADMARARAISRC